MLKYITQFKNFNEIMGLLYRILDIRITFFDMRGYEQDTFEIKSMTPFCQYFRHNKDNDRRCRECDMQHLKFAKQVKRNHIYHCHKGLLEGIIPLYDRHGMYMGAIVFGQLRDCNHKFEPDDLKEEKLYDNLRAVTMKEVEDIGLLLKLVSEYIIENEIIKYRDKPWVECIEDYINNNLNKNIRLHDLSLLVKKSPSFLSHNFPKAFGMSFKNYLLKIKMHAAIKIMKSGFSIKETAFQLGFYDEFHFSKRFKQYFGDAPSTYKTKK